MAINYTVDVEEKLIINGVEFEGVSYAQITDMINDIEAEEELLTEMKAKLILFRATNLLRGQTHEETPEA